MAGEGTLSFAYFSKEAEGGRGPATLRASLGTLAPWAFPRQQEQSTWALTLMLPKSGFSPLLGTPLSEPRPSQPGAPCAVLVQTWLGRTAHDTFGCKASMILSLPVAHLRRNTASKVCWQAGQADQMVTPPPAA